MVNPFSPVLMGGIFLSIGFQRGDGQGTVQVALLGVFLGLSPHLVKQRYIQIHLLRLLL